MSLSHPPEDPEFTSEPKVLSPVSPKPLHYPTPTNIPILQNQIDPDFNQMDAHIGNEQTVGASAEEQSGGPETVKDIASEAGADHIDDSVTMSGLTADTAPQAVDIPTASTDSEMHTVSANAPPITSRDTVPQEISIQGGPGVALPDVAISSEPSSHVISATDTQSSNPPSQQPQSDPNPAPSNPDYQALLTSLASTTKTKPASQDSAPSYIPLDDTATASSQVSSGGITSAASSSLPPRPPPQAQPSIHPNYDPATDIRRYHPHASSGVPQAAPGAPLPAGANGLPPPPVASFQNTSSVPQNAPAQISPTQVSFPGHIGSGREGRQIIDSIVFDNEPKWGPEIQRKFEQFLDAERNYVTEGNWEQFPYGSRLFVGNLSSERVTKRDVFHVFHKYGKLAQISIKQAYGFVQFLNSADCGQALSAEQGQIIRGKRINLEISKPQKNRPGAVTGRRRSRSPERGGIDRYTSGDRRSVDLGRRGRDDYRPGRSPSPRAYRDRSRDRFGRYRSRSRSRSPQRRGGRHRSRSRRRSEDDDLPLPRRAPPDVPDVQIIVVDDLDRKFVQWVEQGIAARGIKVDVLLLSPRLAEAAVIKRQVVEGVTAVSKLSRYAQQTAKIPLQVFDRRGGSDVRFEEYADLDPSIAAEVVLRAKANNQTTYGYGYGAGPGQSFNQPPQFVPPPATMPANLSGAITSMDASGLQKLLGAMQQQPGQAGGMTPDLAKLLGASGVTPVAPHNGYGQQQQQQQQQQDPLAALRNNPAFAGLLAGAQQQQAQSPQQQQQQRPPSSGQPDMAGILAKLGTYKR